MAFGKWRTDLANFYLYFWPLILLVKLNGEFFLPNAIGWQLFAWQKCLVELTPCRHYTIKFCHICRSNSDFQTERKKVCNQNVATNDRYVKVFDLIRNWFYWKWVNSHFFFLFFVVP
jgi:hypothetical protein